MTNKAHIVAILLTLFSVVVIASPDSYQDASLPLYREAFEKMINGAYADAVASFEAMLSTFPESSRADDAAFNIGYCLEKLGDLPEAFKQYEEVIAKYPNSISARKAEKRAVDLARRLRTTKEDQYAKFLQGIFNRQNASFTRLTAMRMAEFGDWRGQDILIETLDNGNVVEQIRAAELLARKAGDEKVSAALRNVLLQNRNSVVRINALRGLVHYSDDVKVREALVTALKTDASEIIRSAVARSIGRFIGDDEEVRDAFDDAILHEVHPMVLQQVILISLASQDADEFKGKMVRRLEAEKNPMVQYIFSSALGEELKHADNVELVENLVNNPEPMVRVNVLRTLQPRAEEPGIKIMFVDKLKNDPDTHVRVVALNALKNDANNLEVRNAVVTILRESNDVTLVTTSIHVIQPQVAVPEIRNELISVLSRAEQPVVAGQAAFALLPELGQENVRKVVFGRLEQGVPFDIKYAVSSALISTPPESSEFVISKLKPLFLGEDNLQLAINYLRAIQRLDPKTAAELRKQRNIIGFSYQFEVKEKREER